MNSTLNTIIENWPISMGAFGAFFWAMFFVRSVLAWGYKPYKLPYWRPTAVIAVNYREGEEVVRRSIESVMAGTKVPDVMFVVFNGKPLGYEQDFAVEMEAKYTNLRFIHRMTPGKRPAQVNGIRAVKAWNWGRPANQKVEHVVLMDGDTVWQKDTLEELIKPFADERIEAIAAAQEFFNPDESIYTQITALLVFWGHRLGQRWQSAKLCSSCLRGRTNAFRLSTLLQPGLLERHENWSLWMTDPVIQSRWDERGKGFFGVMYDALRKLFSPFQGRISRISGDDGSFTFLVLEYAWERERKLGGTFIQMTSVIWTLAEPGWDKFQKMRVRCIGNTTSRYLDGVFRPWFWQQSWRFKIELVNSLVIPMGFIFCVVAFGRNIVDALIGVAHADFAPLAAAASMFVWFMVGRFIRSFGFAERKWVRIARWPLMILIFIGPLVVLRWKGTLNAFKSQTSWGSRTDTTTSVSFSEAQTTRSIGD